MSLHYRKRGDVWHCRGSVRVGRQSFTVREFSTGCSNKADAEAVGAAEESRVRNEFLSTGSVVEPVRTVTVHDCITIYKARPGGLHPFDVQRLDELDAAMGSVTLGALREAWGGWIRGRGKALAPSTIARWRSTLLAALTYGADEFGAAAPTLRAVSGLDGERIAYLTPQQEARLLGAYSQWAAPVIIVLCETGVRTQEALRLDWRHVDWQRMAIIIEHGGRRDGPRTKSGKSRRVGMRPVVHATLMAIWTKRDRPDSGAVFLSKLGKGEHSAQLIDHLKKVEMAKEAERLLDGTGWLPEPLRLAGAEPAANKGEALPAFLNSEEGEGNTSAHPDETLPQAFAAE